MKGLNIKIVLVVIVLFLLSISGFSWHGEGRILPAENIISLIKDRDSSVIFAASQRSVYKTDDRIGTWKEIYHITKANKNIKKLYINHFDNAIYVLTEDGLYQSKNTGSSWQRVFRGGSDLESSCLSLVISNKTLYLGTKQGLFMNDGSSRGWYKLLGHFSDSIISSIVINPEQDNIIYIASEKGVFITHDHGQSWERIYIIYNSEIPSEDYGDYDEEVVEQIVGIYNMAISYKNPHRVYIVTNEGIFFTDKEGNKWQKITNTGLASLNVRSIMVSEDKDELFVTTDKGVFEFSKDRWQKISNGLSYQDFYDLVIDDDSSILVAGKGGLYRINTIDSESLPETIQNIQQEQDISNLFKGEPSIAEVQKAAIKYADVDINKIKSWRRQSRIKALFPDLSVSYDKSIYGASSGAMAIGPRDWSLGLSWDVADLIWSSDQTSIDSRSRLTVQLRQDILDQVTHFYYERRRLIAQIKLNPPVSKEEQIRNSIQLQEITASLDSLTNGFFSNSLNPKE